jgi:hypothetical protein
MIPADDLKRILHNHAGALMANMVEAMPDDAPGEQVEAILLATVKTVVNMSVDLAREGNTLIERDFTDPLKALLKEQLPSYCEGLDQASVYAIVGEDGDVKLSAVAIHGHHGRDGEMNMNDPTFAQLILQCLQDVEGIPEEMMAKVNEIMEFHASSTDGTFKATIERIAAVPEGEIAAFREEIDSLFPTRGGDE